MPTVSSRLAITAYLLGVLLMGALLAPALFWAGQAAGGWHSLGWLRHTDFQRYFDRAMLLAALGLLWPAVRALRVTGIRELGLERDPRRWPNVAFGFVAAAAMLGLLAVLLCQAEVYEPRLHFAWGTLGSMMIAALGAAVLEELLFRGALLGLVQRTTTPRSALAFVSALFAVVHFLKPPPHIIAGPAVNWASGFSMLPYAFSQFDEPRLVLSGFTTLFAIGWILGEARQRTRSLWLSIGLHTGWVFGLKCFAASTRHYLESSLLFGENAFTGLGPLAIVCLTGLLVRTWLRETAPYPPPSLP